jgi:hypothetical protein
MEYLNTQEEVVQGNDYEYTASGEISRWEQTRAAQDSQEWELEGVMHFWLAFAGEDFGDSPGTSDAPVCKSHWSSE